jgi:hypothetical protein
MTVTVMILTQSGVELKLMVKGKTFQRWVPALIIIGVIFLASSIPANQMPNIGKLDFPVKKGSHFSGYALLALGLLRGMHDDKPRNLVLVLLFCGLYAVSDEFHQSFVPGRKSSPIDIGIDFFGSAFGLLLFLWFAPIRRLVYK